MLSLFLYFFNLKNSSKNILVHHVGTGSANLSEEWECHYFMNQKRTDRDFKIFLVYSRDKKCF